MKVDDKDEVAKQEIKAASSRIQSEEAIVVEERENEG